MSDPIYQDATMAQVRAVDGTFISYPFSDDSDTETKVYNMACTQLASSYDASQIALDTPMSSAAAAGVIALPFPADSAAYFVGDTGHTPAGGGMISFTRTFANIPKSITVSSGSTFVTFPGLGETYIPISSKQLTSVSMSLGLQGLILTTSSNHQVAAGESVNVVMSYTVGTSPFVYSSSGEYKVIDTPTDTTLRVDVGHYFDEQVVITLVEGTLTKGNTTRSPVSINVPFVTRYQYILPGVTPGVTNPTDLSVPRPFGVTDLSTGDITNTVKTLGGTHPSYDQYMSMVDDGAHIVIESSLSEWAGNILVLKTKTCKAR